MIDSYLLLARRVGNDSQRLLSLGFKALSKKCLDSFPLLINAFSVLVHLRVKKSFLLHLDQEVRG